MINRPFCGVVVLMCMLSFSSLVQGDEAQIIRDLSARGAKLTESKGIVTEAHIADATTWTDDDFKKLAQLTHLQSVDFGKGVTDEQLALLAPLGELTYLQTNAIAVSDAGIKSLSQFKKLRTLKFFHPGKSFTGVGLADPQICPENSDRSPWPARCRSGTREWLPWRNCLTWSNSARGTPGRPSMAWPN